MYTIFFRLELGEVMPREVMIKLLVGDEQVFFKGNSHSDPLLESGFNNATRFRSCLSMQSTTHRS